MWMKTEKFQFLSGEPHLGSVEETELMCDEEEVYYLIAEIIQDEGIVPSVVSGIDDYTEEDIEVEVNDWIDDSVVDKLNEWIEEKSEEADFASLDEILEKIRSLV